jgi:hypothetical protein
MTVATPAAAAPAAPAAAAAPATPAAPATGTPASGQPAAAQPPAAAAAPAVKPTILGGSKEPSKDGKPAAEPAASEPAKQGAPEKYADFKLPEGVNLDKALMDKALPLFKKHNLSQDAAQEFADLQAQSVKADNEARLAAFNSQVEDWGKQARSQFGADADKNLGFAAKAVERFGSPELRALLDESGLGNHPLLVKMLAKVGDALREDQPVEGRKAGAEQDTASMMFPTMKKKS